LKVEQVEMKLFKIFCTSVWVAGNSGRSEWTRIWGKFRYSHSSRSIIIVYLIWSISQQNINLN